MGEDAGHVEPTGISKRNAREGPVAWLQILYWMDQNNLKVQINQQEIQMKNKRTRESSLFEAVSKNGEISTTRRKCRVEDGQGTVTRQIDE